MVKTTRVFLLSLLTILMAAQAQAFEFAAVGSGTFSNESFSNLSSGTTASTTTHAGYGGGALVNFHLAPRLSFEPGVLYTKKKWDVAQTVGAVTTTTNNSAYYLQIPGIFRFWFGPIFSVGAGGFWERGMSGNYSSPRNDAGVVGSVAFRLPLGSHGVKFLADGRYYWGLTNFGSSGSSIYFRDVQALAGFAFPLGSSR